MPWHIEADNPDCAGFAVVKDSNGEIEGCHRSRAQAERQMAALYAAEPEAQGAGVPTEAMAEEAQRGLDPNVSARSRRVQVEEMLAQLRASR